VDVRSATEYGICRIEPSVNLPWSTLKRMPGDEFQAWLKAQPTFSSLVLLCRRGNDSQLAVQYVTDLGADLAVQDLQGGLHAWARQVDSEFPVY
jgi:adenylyltransferase/sulfurtransferase